RSRGVALRAAGAVLAAVHLGLGVTAEAVGRPRLERDRWMAVVAPHLEVLSVEVERRHRVVVEDVVAGLDVALLALVAEPLLVRVVVGVAALRRARRVGLGELALGVTRLALVLEVLALERELADLALRVLGERLLVIELERVPGARRMAQHAVRAERAVVERV